MGQTSSQPNDATRNVNLVNIYHVCNIIPDTPEHGFVMWEPDYASATAAATGSAARAPTPADVPDAADAASRAQGHEPRHAGRRPRERYGTGERGLSERGRRRVRRERRARREHKARSEHHMFSSDSEARAEGGRGGGDGGNVDADAETDDAGGSSATSASARLRARRRVDYTTDDEFDGPPRTLKRQGGVGGRNLARHRKVPPTITDVSDCDVDRARHTVREPRTTVSRNSMASTTDLPPTLDHRYDLDVAPSMLNMNLQFNGAYMVAANIYSILARKFEYRHMLSVQMLFWAAVQRYYRSQILDTSVNYKLSLATLLDVAQTTSLCSERELSIYANPCDRHRACVRRQHADADNAPASSASGPVRPTHHADVASTQFEVRSLAHGTSGHHSATAPFFHMQHYYVPKDTRVLKEALYHDHLILANLTLFSNIQSARHGAVEPPTVHDVQVGMVVVTLIGYQHGVWIARFPFGVHWGDHGIGYISEAYFDRYNRDRWIVDIEESSEPPEYRTQREQAQAKGDRGMLPVHLDDVHLPGGGAWVHGKSAAANAPYVSAPDSYARDRVTKAADEAARGVVRQRRRMCA